MTKFLNLVLSYPKWSVASNSMPRVTSGTLCHAWPIGRAQIESVTKLKSFALSAHFWYQTAFSSGQTWQKSTAGNPRHSY